MVEIERMADGNWRVSRTLPCLSSAHAAAMALERVVPEAFAAVNVTVTNTTGEPVDLSLRAGMEHAP